MSCLKMETKELKIWSLTRYEGKKAKVKSLSRVRLFVTPWTVAYQAPLSMEFSRQEYCSGLPFPSPGDRPNPGIEPGSPAFQADALPPEPLGKPCSIPRAAECLGSQDTWLLGHQLHGLGQITSPLWASVFTPGQSVSLKTSSTSGPFLSCGIRSAKLQPDLHSHFSRLLKPALKCYGLRNDGVLG